MNVEFEALTAEVHVVRDVVTSAITLINGIADRISAAVASGDPKATVALTEELRASAEALAAAVNANTPAGPEVPPLVEGPLTPDPSP